MAGNRYTNEQELGTYEVKRQMKMELSFSSNLPPQPREATQHTHQCQAFQTENSVSNRNNASWSTTPTAGLVSRQCQGEAAHAAGKLLVPKNGLHYMPSGGWSLVGKDPFPTPCTNIRRILAPKTACPAAAIPNLGCSQLRPASYWTAVKRGHWAPWQRRASWPFLKPTCQGPTCFPTAYGNRPADTMTQPVEQPLRQQP